MSENERKIAERIINDFGQTPSQLLKDPHPSRKSHSDWLESQLRDNKPVSLLTFFKKLRCYRTDVSAYQTGRGSFSQHDYDLHSSH